MVFPLNIYLLWNKIIFLCTITLYYRRQRTFIVGSGNNFFFWAGESCLDMFIHQLSPLFNSLSTVNSILTDTSTGLSVRFQVALSM